MQSSDGSFSGADGANAESIAQVIVALTTLGIDPDTDERFVKSQGSAMDALLAFATEDGGFCHIPNTERNTMSTEQGYYALVSYARFLEGDTPLYDMTDLADFGGDTQSTPEDATVPETTQMPAATEPEPSPSIPWWGFLLIALGILAVCVFFVLRKKLQ